VKAGRARFDFFTGLNCHHYCHFVVTKIATTSFGQPEAARLRSPEATL
jgi:hypothetical protein